MSTKEIVIFCVIDEPFICEIHGKFNIAALEEMEKQFAEDPPDNIEYNVATITYECVHFGGQYDGYGCCEIPAYWEFS